MKFNKEKIKYNVSESLLVNIVNDEQKQHIANLLLEDTMFNIVQEFTQKHIGIKLSDHMMSDSCLLINELFHTGIDDVNFYDCNLSIRIKIPISYFKTREYCEPSKVHLLKNKLRIGLSFKSKNDDSKDATFKDATFDIFPDSLADNNLYTYSFGQSIVFEVKAQKEGLSPYSSKIFSTVSEDKFSKSMMEIDPASYIKYVYPLIRTIQSECEA